jgi:hypothetical protein
MTHFAIPGGEFPPAEAELASVVNSDEARLGDFAPLGLLIIAREFRFTVILIAETTSFDADKWWTR